MNAGIETTDTLSENQSEWPEVAIVVLNWNNFDDTAECLESLKKINYPNYRVIVVDNGSTDGSGKCLQKKYEWCEVIYNDKNLGYSAGMNVGINRALSEGTDYILLLNNDVVVDSNFLSPLVATVEEDEDVGIVSGVIEFADGKGIHSAGRKYNPYFIRSPHIQEVKEMTEYEVECISGALALFPSKTISNLGGLDESYFLGPDDIDMSFRVRQSGKKVVINTDSSVRHKIGSTGGTGNALRYYHSTKGRLDLASKYATTPQKLIFWNFFILTRLVLFILWTVKGKKQLISAVVLGVYDYMNGSISKNREGLFHEKY